ILPALPEKSPTVGLIWPSAIFTVPVQSGGNSTPSRVGVAPASCRLSCGRPARTHRIASSVRGSGCLDQGLSGAALERGRLPACLWEKTGRVLRLAAAGWERRVGGPRALQEYSQLSDVRCLLPSRGA